MSPVPQACPVPVCTGSAPPGMLMCRSCWYRVPPRLKSLVGATWRAWSADLGNLDKAKRYRIAKNDAIDATAMR